jgi:hypothetical protein
MFDSARDSNLIEFEFNPTVTLDSNFSGSVNRRLN